WRVLLWRLLPGRHRDRAAPHGGSVSRLPSRSHEAARAHALDGPRPGAARGRAGQRRCDGDPATASGGRAALHRTLPGAVAKRSTGVGHQERLRRLVHRGNARWACLLPAVLTGLAVGTESRLGTVALTWRSTERAKAEPHATAASGPTGASVSRP